MNDWYLDPPEVPEPPECPSCHEGFGDIITISSTEHKDAFCCDVCGHIWDIPIEPDPDPEDFGPSDLEEDLDFFRPYPEHCPHGKPWGECSSCDSLSDLLYDAQRERSRR